MKIWSKNVKIEFTKFVLIEKYLEKSTKMIIFSINLYCFRFVVSIITFIVLKKMTNLKIIISNSINNIILKIFFNICFIIFFIKLWQLQTRRFKYHQSMQFSKQQHERKHQRFKYYQSFLWRRYKCFFHFFDFYRRWNSIFVFFSLLSKKKIWYWLLDF